MLQVISNIEKNLQSFNNNSLSIRYILAFLVFYSHMFAIYGLSEPTFLWGSHSLGWYAVNGFFFISGLMIAQSYMSRDIKSYAVARILRIMPAYLASLVVVIVTVVLFSDISFNQEWFFRFVKFIYHNLIPLDASSMGMSGTWSMSSQPTALNNSVWTIPFEIFCYIVVTPFLLSRKKYTLKQYILYPILILIYLKLLGTISIKHLNLDLLRVIIYFALGVSFYMVIISKKINRYFIIFLLGLFIFEGSLSETLLGYVIITIILFFGFYLKSFWHFKNDYSYGLYVYACPISQAVNGGDSKCISSHMYSFCIFIYPLIFKLDLFRKTFFKYEK